MANLVVLIVENEEPIRCTDLIDAKSKAASTKSGRIVVEITPEGAGGPMTTLEFDRNTQEWVPI